LEQHEDNVPIMQRYIDKWFWRGYRLLALVGTMMDYMLPKKVMSWAEAWGIYWEENGMALFHDLERYGIKPPKYHEIATQEKNHITHQAWTVFYTACPATAFHAWLPQPYELDWLSEKYGETFERYYRPRFEQFAELERAGERFYTNRLPLVCQTCQVPVFFTEVNNPMQQSVRQLDWQGMKFNFCSDGCKDIFAHEPEKFCQAYIPPQQIYQGNAGGARNLQEYAAWLKCEMGKDSGEYYTSEDYARWKQWHGGKDTTPSSAAA
jgi:phenol hydroxylase P3 protein